MFIYEYMHVCMNSAYECLFSFFFLFIVVYIVYILAVPFHTTPVIVHLAYLVDRNIYGHQFM